jgi:hypothetical protein
MPTTTFQPQVIQSQASLRHFLSGQTEKAEILRAGKARMQPVYSGNCPLIEECYYLFCEVILTIGSHLTHLFGMTDLSRRLWVFSRHAIYDAAAIKTQRVFQENFLVKAANTHRVCDEPAYLQPDTKTKLPTYPKSETVQWFHTHGVCRGMSLWFVHLYLKTKLRFRDTEQHLRAVGEQFKDGAPVQAALLQSLQPQPAHELLHLKTQESQIATRGQTEDQILSQLQAHPPGVYGVYTSCHQVVYIKVDSSRQFLFDANRGTLKLVSPHLFKQAMEGYLRSHNSTLPLIVDRYTF